MIFGHTSRFVDWHPHTSTMRWWNSSTPMSFCWQFPWISLASTSLQDIFFYMASVLLLFFALRDGTVTREDALMLWLGGMLHCFTFLGVVLQRMGFSLCFPQCFPRGSQIRRFFHWDWLQGWGTLLVPEWFCMVLVWWFWMFRCVRLQVGTWYIGVSLVAATLPCCWWEYHLGLSCQVWSWNACFVWWLRRWLRGRQCDDWDEDDDEYDEYE